MGYFVQPIELAWYEYDLLYHIRKPYLKLLLIRRILRELLDVGGSLVEGRNSRHVD